MVINPSILSKRPVYIAYTIIGLMIVTFSGLTWINYYTFSNSEKVKHDAIKLEKLIGEVIFYDEALTMSASMAFATGNLKWKEKYTQFANLYHKAFAELLKISSYSSAGVPMQKATDALLSTEKEGFNLLDKGKKEEAAVLLESATYADQKEVYSNGLNKLILDNRILTEGKLKESKKYSFSAIGFSALGIILSFLGWLIIINEFKKWRKVVIAVTEEDRQLNWINSGLTQLDNILRTNLENPVKLFSSVINFLAHYVDAGNGVIFKSYFNKRNDIILKPVASYAYNKELLKKIKVGEGLLGQAALEKRTLIIDNVPDSYLPISSGLGEIKPKSIIILPVVFEPKLKGVIELAFAEEISNTKRAFLDKAVRVMASSMVLLARTKETERLLKEAQDLTSHLQVNEEKLMVQHKELVTSNLRLEQMRKAKEYFLAHISHEIRTPINNIIGLSNLLKTSSLNHKQDHIVNLLDVSSQSLSLIINDLLDLSKLEAGKLKIVRTETDLWALVNSVVEIMRLSAEKKGLTLLNEIDYTLPHVLILDGLRLNQVLLNLLTNAIKFTKTGSISLSVKELARKQDLIQVEFAVADTGIGMKPEAINRIFDSYEQAEDTTTLKFGGTGLGLSIVKSLVELDGGQFNVKSQEQEGSVFSFTNWYQIADTTVTKINQLRTEKISIANISVLVVEDNPINQHLIIHILKKWGSSYKVVEEGGQALEELKENYYDVILMDGQMEGMNGLEATLAIRKDFTEPKRSIPIISLSSSVLEEEQQAALDAGANAVINKPFDPQDLLVKIKELLNF